MTTTSNNERPDDDTRIIGGKEQYCLWEDRAMAAVSDLGAVYTPQALSDWVASELLKWLPEKTNGVILDPACGDGVLLHSLHTISRSKCRLVGLDISKTAISQAKSRVPKAEFHWVDTLVPSENQPPASFWSSFFKEREIAGIIANPPWGADLAYSAKELRALGYTLAKGQVDSFDLFMELWVRVAPDDAALAFIIPDSIFLPEHESLRRLILAHSSILLIARLGEGFFDGVFRGTAVIVLRKGTAAREHQVACFRLNKTWRKRIFSGDSTLEEARVALSHNVQQTRFSDDAHARFDIDIQESEQQVILQIATRSTIWERFIKSGRGIELSKSGRVIVCPHCHCRHPLPKKDGDFYCTNCLRSFSAESSERESIIRIGNEPEPGWAPLIVGEDVDRHACAASRSIALDIKGINYKEAAIFKGQKLLVRKTGIGIKACVDDSGAFTNQVVFHFYVPAGVSAPDFLLHYLQGVLCSRTLLAYHLKKLGENEWRSHPYITQKIVHHLPVPDFAEGSWEWKQAQAIAEAVRKRPANSGHDSEEDLLIENLVAGLYGLSTDDCQWVVRVLEEAQDLEPIRTLRLTDPSQFLPVKVM